MDLKLEILKTSMKEKSLIFLTISHYILENYFLMIQMDELEFPDKILKTTKFRTEVIPMSFYPDFKKNNFMFPKLSLGF